MQTDLEPSTVRIRLPRRRRGYRIALTISLIMNVVLAAALYLYSSVEGFLSTIAMAVGLFN